MQLPVKMAVRNRLADVASDDNHVCVENLQAYVQADSVSSPDICLVTHDEMNEIIRTENFQGFLVEWRDLNLEERDWGWTRRWWRSLQRELVLKPKLLPFARELKRRDVVQLLLKMGLPLMIIGEITDTRAVARREKIGFFLSLSYKALRLQRGCTVAGRLTLIIPSPPSVSNR